MAFSSMRNLARSGVSLPLLRTQLERTQFVRSFWKGSRGRLEKGMQEKLKYLIDQGVKIEMVEDKNQPVGKYTLEMHPYTMEVIQVWAKQLKILGMLTDLHILAETKLTLRESGLLASLYKHGPNDTWRAVAQRIKGKTTRSVYELKTVETRLDEIRALAKEISTVLIVYQKQKKTALQPKDNRTEVLPHDFGSILIKLSQLRLKWKAIASLESATLLDDSEMDELVEIEATIKEVHNIVVVQQLLEKDV
uniref:uncharacterized protein LOC101300888 isoform X2 n=1 Tax=Fragaria vesca subsp. vesca TaxID=101020 RepID=UPI0005CACCF8|nr:PREDICTED: uncharacterized protein LOC101300888 isoform X2 [Fragaria vesca subsp. vesca]